MVEKIEQEKIVELGGFDTQNGILVRDSVRGGVLETVTVFYI